MKTACARFALVIGLMIGLPLVAASAAPDWPIPSGVKTVEVNGYPIAYVEAGSGVPVVILHGVFVDHRLFAFQVAEFAKTHRVIAVSLRHHYPEPWDGKAGAYSIGQHAADVAALIRTLNLGKVHLIGHSRGGSVAINTARQAPEFIRTLILEDPSGLEPLLADESIGRQRSEGMAALAVWVGSELEKGDRAKTAQDTWSKLFGATWGKWGPEVQQMNIDNVGTLAAKTPLDIPPINCDDIRRFNFPILILHGERSSKIYSDMSTAMRQCKPDIAAATVVPNATHMIHLDNAAFFDAAVLEFMQQN